MHVMTNDYVDFKSVCILTSVCHISHGVFKSPYNRVKHKFKLGWWDGKECWETVRVHRLQQVEEMCPVFWVFLKVLNKKNTHHIIYISIYMLFEKCICNIGKLLFYYRLK